MTHEKYYFRCDQSDPEYCYSVKSLLLQMKEDGLIKMEIEEAKTAIGADAFWCKAEGEIMGKGYDYCGKSCEHYKPRNGKSGICKHYGFTFEPSGKIVTLNIDGTIERNPNK